MSKPFVKWAGGKYALASTLKEYLPSDFDNLRYFEPMVGGGGMFFRLNLSSAYLSDINEKLINTYQCIKEDVNSVIHHLKSYEKHHHDNDEYYYAQREKFNENSSDKFEMASLFIYLNKTCFNGLYRENSKGEFNVPKGRTSSGTVTICDEDNLVSCSKLFENIEFECHSYEDILPNIDSNSFVYLDPPYLPLNKVSFTKYTKDDFTEQMHFDLKHFCDKLSEEGARFMMSNSDTEKTREIYSRYDMKEILVNRSVGSSSKSRKKAAELIITNY